MERRGNKDMDGSVNQEMDGTINQEMVPAQTRTWMEGRNQEMDVKWKAGDGWKVPSRRWMET